MHIVVDGCQYDIAEILMGAGASTKIKDHVGKTAIEYAQTTEMMRILGNTSFSKDEESSIVNEERLKPANTIGNVSSESTQDNISNNVPILCKVSTSCNGVRAETFDEYLKRMKEKESVCSQPEAQKELKSEPVEMGNEDLVRIETQLTKSNKMLDTLREEDSKFEDTNNEGLHKILEENHQSLIKIEDMLDLPTTNMNYCADKIMPNFVLSPQKSQLFSNLNGEMQIAVFKTMKNDIPENIKRPSNKKSKIIMTNTDVCNELIEQIEKYQNTASFEMNNTNSLDPSRIHIESLLSQTNKSKAQNGGMEEMLDLKNDAKSRPSLMKGSVFQPPVCPILLENSDCANFPKSSAKTNNLNRHTIACCNTQLKCSTQNGDQITFRNVDPKPHIDLDQWLENLKLKHIGLSLAKCGVLTLETLLRQLKGLNYENSLIWLKSKGVERKGNRDRIILAAEHEHGKFKQFVEERMKENRGPKQSVTLRKSQITFNNPNTFGFQCCTKPPKMHPDFVNPPDLRKWLKDQGLEALYQKFVHAGYDDYEWILIQMVSMYPLTEEIFENDIGIKQPAYRTRILYKLQEGIFLISKKCIESESYLEQVLVPKYGLNTMFENVSKNEACGCILL